MVEGLDVQRDPYSHLLSEWEKQSARNLPFRFACNGIAAGGAALYYLSRHNEVGRVRALRISIDMLVNVAARAALAAVISDQVSRRMFVNYSSLKRH